MIDYAYGSKMSPEQDPGLLQTLENFCKIGNFCKIWIIALGTSTLCEFTNKV